MKKIVTSGILIVIIFATVLVGMYIVGMGNKDTFKDLDIETTKGDEGNNKVEVVYAQGKLLGSSMYMPSEEELKNAVAEKKDDIKQEESKEEKDITQKEQPKKETIKKPEQKVVVKEETKKEQPKQEVKTVTAKQTPPKQEVKPQQAVIHKEEPITAMVRYSTVILNVRGIPSTKGKQIGQLKKGEKVTVTKKSVGNGITWYYIDDKKGWVSGNYLQTEPLKQIEVSKKPVSTPSATSTKKYKPMHIYYGNKAVPYKNSGQSGGQATIDKTNYASTWGGASVFSGLDGKNTHLIGHNGGRNQFGGMHTQSVFIVTDAQGRAFRYVKTTMYVVNEYGVRTSDGKNMWDRIVGTGGGERITLQSTKKHPLKYIVEAKFDKQIQ